MKWFKSKRQKQVEKLQTAFDLMERFLIREVGVREKFVAPYWTNLWESMMPTKATLMERIEKLETKFDMLIEHLGVEMHTEERKRGFRKIEKHSKKQTVE